MTPARLDRSTWPAARARPARIVHIGAGNFSRAHQAWYTQLADPDGEWGIVAFSGRDGEVAAELGRQGGLYTLVERGPARDRLTVIDSIVDARSGSDLQALSAAVAAPSIAVVTLTVTEAGYAAEPLAGRLSAQGLPEVDPPQLPPVLKRLTQALAARRAAGGGPLALVSCDNLHANGEVLGARTLAYAGAAQDPGLASWVEHNVSFVSTSVDRITPRTTDADRRLVARELRLTDAVPVVCEPFSDWVLCGDFPAGRPHWEAAGARFVDELEPWELRKLWLLNGAHSLLAYTGLLRGHATVADAIGDPDLRVALERFWDLAQRHLPNANELDLPHYQRQLVERFRNARIGYPLTQIATDGLAKLRNRVVPVVDVALTAGEPLEAVKPALHVVTTWIHWLLAQRLTLDSTLRNVPDADADQIKNALTDAGGGDPTPALVQLLAPAWNERPDLVAALIDQRAELSITTNQPNPPDQEDRP